jgi:hypothetical protein
MTTAATSMTTMRPVDLDELQGGELLTMIRRAARSSAMRERRAKLSAPLENEAIVPLENGATQTDWLGDLSGGLGADPAAGR